MYLETALKEANVQDQSNQAVFTLNSKNQLLTGGKGLGKCALPFVDL